MGKNSDEASILTILFGMLCFLFIGMLIFVSNVWVKPINAIEQGAFEYDGEVYLVEKAPPGTIIKDGKVYITELFNETSEETQTQPQD